MILGWIAKEIFPPRCIEFAGPFCIGRLEFGRFGGFGGRHVELELGKRLDRDLNALRSLCGAYAYCLRLVPNGQ